MAKFIRLAIALTFFFVADHASGLPFPAKPHAAFNEPLIIKAQGAQFNFGVSDGVILGSLSRQGYSDIKITKKRLTKARAEACKDGTRFDVEVAFDGRIRRATKIGKCRSPVNLEVARKILRKKGYRKIQVRPAGNGYVAAACRNNRRFRVFLDQFGGIQGEKILGKCGGNLTQYDIAALLRAQGFSRVRTKRERKGNYSVKACRHDDAMALLVSRNGEILRERRVGRCDPPIHPATIPALLARYGFTRIDIIDRKLPRYMAHACRQGQRLEVSMNRFGEIVDERSIGRCEVTLRAADLEIKLRDAGYDQIRIVEDRPGGFVAEVCERGSLLRLELTKYGETISENRLGNCPSRRVGKILRQFEKNGMTGATIYIEGCRKKKQYRIELDRYGTITRRDIIGRCR